MGDLEPIVWPEEDSSNHTYYYLIFEREGQYYLRFGEYRHLGILADYYSDFGITKQEINEMLHEDKYIIEKYISGGGLATFDFKEKILKLWWHSNRFGRPSPEILEKIKHMVESDTDIRVKID